MLYCKALDKNFYPNYYSSIDKTRKKKYPIITQTTVVV